MKINGLMRVASPRPLQNFAYESRAQSRNLTGLGRFEPTPASSLSSGINHVESQQNISGGATEAGIAGINVHHAVDDDGSGPIERAAVGSDAIDRAEGGLGIEIP